MHVAILVPFRDEPRQNRAAHLAHFLAHMPAILDKAKGLGDTWRIYVGVQSQDGRKFARGRLLNALFHYVQAANSHQSLDVIVLHDVDLVPDVKRAFGYFARVPAGAVTALNSTGEYSDMAGYIGGICAMAPATFVAADGFPNAMEGWGGEDDALRDRLGLERVGRFLPGTVHNLETDPKFHDVVLHARAKNCEELKMPKFARRDMRAKWKARDPALTGLERVYYRFTQAVTRSPVHETCYFDISVPEPPGWRVRFSKTRLVPFYFHEADLITQWQEPSSACKDDIAGKT